MKQKTMIKPKRKNIFLKKKIKIELKLLLKKYNKNFKILKI